MTSVRDLKKFRQMARKFNLLDARMQISTVLTLVEVAIADAEKRTLNTRDLEKAVGVVSGTASRNTYYWADGHKAMSGAYNFVRVSISAEDRRYRQLGLTDRGKLFINDLTGEKPDGETSGEPLAS